MSKEKVEKRFGSEIAAERIETLRAQMQSCQDNLKARKSYLESTVKKREALGRKERAGDSKAKAEREQLRIERARIGAEIEDLESDLVTIGEDIETTEKEHKDALDHETGDRIVGRQATVKETSLEFWSHYTAMEKCIKRLWGLTKEDQTDATLLGFGNVSNPQFEHTRNPYVVLKRLVARADKDGQLGGEDFFQELPALVDAAQKAQRERIQNRLRGQIENDAQEKEAKVA